MKWYFYLGLAMLIFANLNFYFVIQPFALWYIPIIWFGYIFLLDGIVFHIRKKSFISAYPKEFLLMVIVSVPFWGISELYNIFSTTWIYLNYVWYVHIVDFTIIMPAMAETFFLVSALGAFDRARVKLKGRVKHLSGASILLALFGVAILVSPFIFGFQNFPLAWLGIFFTIDPINQLLGNDSIFGFFVKGDYRRILRLFAAGLIMGFFWECWNYLAYPKWFYYMPWLIYNNVKLFEMPIFGYLGYLIFALDVYAFYTLVRSAFFKGKNPLEMFAV